MSNLEALILGLIQGLTEFLPISSSGHLEIGKTFFGNNYQDYDSLLLTLVLHLGTALSTIFVFKKEIFEILSSLLKLKNDDKTLFALKIAILPGISRSGSTISMALILGIHKEKAAQFSFLMVLPVIFGGIFKLLLDIEKTSVDIDYLSLGIGFFTAFISGFFACKWMVTIVRNSKLKNFSFYCIFVGVISIFYGLF